MIIFEFKSYKEFLKAYCKSERGALSRLAEAADCQKSYLSICMTGKGQLSLDQAYGIAEHLGLSDAEVDYFFLLIDKDKASTPKLKKKLETKIKDLARESFRLKNQQRESVIINEPNHDVGFYYSTW